MTPLAERFWPKVDTTADCWTWQAQKDRNGYGRIRPGGTASYVRAHRAAWYLATGEWPPADVMVCHRCDNPSCVRFDHLFLGSARDNARDMSGKRRARGQDRTHCPRGHAYNEENTYHRNDHGPANRQCRACDRERKREMRKQVSA